MKNSFIVFTIIVVIAVSSLGFHQVLSQEGPAIYINDTSHNETTGGEEELFTSLSDNETTKGNEETMPINASVINASLPH